MSQLHSYKLTNMNLMPSLAMFTINLVPTCHARVYYKRRGCLYGQRTASMEWYRTLCAHLVSEGLSVGKNDPCVYVNPITKVRLVVVVVELKCHIRM